MKKKYNEVFGKLNEKINLAKKGDNRTQEIQKAISEMFKELSNSIPKSTKE